ncbi:M3 family oligoendopeptidase [Caldisericum exile]|uniref:M3 family peptidase n=1 Tax=Caldisericum exile (strain DSM 21853 / NBRC 104410 / AZM16c01) TaxID=511051 RepID=A0A7U6GEY1_CALEA|nr:M3 family oligoendopeptidase [Caldisericum exile]BAL81130.1 putative M3 family peptidase [Caldisericum exile AZM16c01]
MEDLVIKRRPRKYYREDFTVENKENFERALRDLLNEPTNNKDELLCFLEKWGELSDILEETYAWKYINMTRFMDKKEYQDDFNKFYSEVVSLAMQYDFMLKKKYYDLPARHEFTEPEFKHLDTIISNAIEIFREENIPLFVKEHEISNKYGEIIAKLTVNFRGEEKTFSQMNVFLKDPDRGIREEAWQKKYEALSKVSTDLAKIFDQLKEIRVKQAKNAGFENYRDYKHIEKGRFSYTVQDVLNFHDVVKNTVVPFLKERNEIKRQKLGLDSLRPWDTSVDVDNRILKPFNTIEEFVDKAIKVLGHVDDEFGINLLKMKTSDFLDLENRIGKAPGGYNMGLPEHGSSFIFMNAVGLNSDVRTLLHESGHSLHSKYTSNILIHPFKDYPMEVAELASMSMEMFTVDYLYEYYDKPEDLKKAKREQIEGALAFLPWCIAVDSFQHYIYTSDADENKREEYFENLMKDLASGVDWSGLEERLRILWMQQLHIFEVPFYYIEYGFAQLGALAMYKNYKENREKTIKNYKEFLSLGYKKPVPELYKVAGIEFKFSEDYVKDLVDFVRDELKLLD